MFTSSYTTIPMLCSESPRNRVRSNATFRPRTKVHFGFASNVLGDLGCNFTISQAYVHVCAAGLPMSEGIIQGLVVAFNDACTSSNCTREKYTKPMRLCPRIFRNLHLQRPFGFFRCNFVSHKLLSIH